MVKLKNIVINGNIAKCDIYPEDSRATGSLEVDLQTKEITSSTLPVGYEWCENHIAHAKNYLVDINRTTIDV
jgi:CxxC motif-containing protein